MRYFCKLSYLGTNYHGWQTQLNAHTIQDEIESALEKLSGKRTVITGSGRTDTGVHAYQQFFHFDSDKKINVKKLLFQLNSILPKDIAVNGLFEVRPEAHARFDAIKRSYIYQIRLNKDPFAIGLYYIYFKELDLELMNLAALKMIGEKDFQCFSKVKTEVNNFICNVSEVKWVRNGDTLKFHISANRFLRGMVRAIVGTLLLVGEGKITTEDFEQIIQLKDRKKAGRAVPPEGLYLSEVIYSDTIYVN